MFKYYIENGVRVDWGCLTGSRENLSWVKATGKGRYSLGTVWKGPKGNGG